MAKCGCASTGRGEGRTGGIVLAQGEATGHAHAIKAPAEAVTLCEIREGGVVTRFLAVQEPVTLSHEEHGVQTIEPGVYSVGIVRERDWLSEDVRAVTD